MLVGLLADKSDLEGLTMVFKFMDTDNDGIITINDI